MTQIYTYFFFLFFFLLLNTRNVIETIAINSNRKAKRNPPTIATTISSSFAFIFTALSFTVFVDSCTGVDVVVSDVLIVVLVVVALVVGFAVGVVGFDITVVVVFVVGGVGGGVVFVVVVGVVDGDLSNAASVNGSIVIRKKYSGHITAYTSSVYKICFMLLCYQSICRTTVYVFDRKSHL